MMIGLRQIVALVFLLLLCIEVRAEPRPNARAKSRSADDKTATAFKAKITPLIKRYFQLVQAGKYREAIPTVQEALDLCVKERGPEAPGTATCLDWLVRLYRELGDYATAETYGQRSLKIREKVFGSEHPETATSLNNLAVLYQDLGDYPKAEPICQRVLRIWEKAYGPEHSTTATGLNNLAELYRYMGDYAKAEPLYQHALKIDEKTAGPEHPDTARGLNNLALLYFDMGDYAKAEPLHKRSLAIRQKALGPEHPDTAESLHNLAMLYHKMGDYARAEPLYQRSFKILEKAFGLEYRDTGRSLNALAELYREMGDYAKAEPLCQLSLKINEKVFGVEHPDTATSLHTLALLYQEKGDYAKAASLYQRALKISEKTLGLDHPETARTLSNLALLFMDAGDPKEGLRLARLTQRAQQAALLNILSCTSEQQRLAFQKTINPYTLTATLGSAPELAEAVLRQKGVVLDSLLEDRLIAQASEDPRQHETIANLRAAKQQLMQSLLEVPRNISETTVKNREARNRELSERVEELEVALAKQVAGLGKTRRALGVTVAQVQAGLPSEAVLVEFLRYQHYLGKKKWESRYGAIVIASIGEAKWIPLGSATDIEKEVQFYQKSVRGETDKATLNESLRALHNQVWAPIEKALPLQATSVIISPDADLNFVSFATLLTPDDGFVGEKYSIRYVASGRDLLGDTKPAVVTTTSLRIFANPNFALGKAIMPAEETNKVALRSAEMRDLQSISLLNLPGTARESAELETRAKKSGWQAQASLGTNATEAELRKVNSPRILHLATHGFFLPEIDLDPPRKSLSLTAADIPKGKLVNPMHRSGLALAGAQTTLQAWAKGEVPPTDNDGIVTAEEVGGLKLDGTWLVVLSACDTGSGEAKAGEGVMGLRRGFIQAGGQNLLMTLWPINDEVTVQIMLDFYDAAFKTGDAPHALADTQRDWLVKLREERGLLPAVQLAGAFIMSSQGKP